MQKRFVVCTGASCQSVSVLQTEQIKTQQDAEEQVKKSGYEIWRPSNRRPKEPVDVETQLMMLMCYSPAYKELIQLNLQNSFDYCKRYGFVLRLHEFDGSRGGRERFILDALQNGTDREWLWFRGADTLITNPNIDARRFLDTQSDIVIGTDVNGFNNDSMFIEINQFTRKFFGQLVDATTQYANDQEAMCSIMGSMPELLVRFVPQRQFNSYIYSEYDYAYDGGGSWGQGDFVVHFPGLPLARRVQLMKEYLTRIEA